MIEVPGKYNLTLKEYHSDPTIQPSLSRGVIYDLLYNSPAYAAFNHPRLNPNFKEEDDKKFDIGSAAHSLLLEGLDKAEIILADDWRSKAAKEARELAIKHEKIPLLEKDHAKVISMVSSAAFQIAECKELGISKLLYNSGQSEMSYFWKEGDTWIRTRPDWEPDDRKIILDYKSTKGSANPEEIARAIVSMGYDIQASLYCRGVKAITGIEPKFIFMFQETYEPYLCSFVGLPPEFMEMGKSKVEYGIFLWQECMSRNEWPGYPNRIAWVEPPPWALASWEKRATGIGVEP